MHLPEVDARLAGHEGDWTFVGDPSWTEDRLGVMYPPVWSNPRFDADPALVPDHYAHPLAREDYAFLSAHPLSDTDVSVDFWCPYGSVLHGGIVFRAADSARCCVLDLADLGRKGQAYELSLWAQDGSGFRREIAKGTAPHSIVSERIVQRGARTREDWVASSPDWVTVRVQASGTFVRVSMDGAIVFDVRGGIPAVGCVGLVARGAVKFRNLKVRGVPADLQPPWSRHEGELPRFFLPGGEQAGGFQRVPRRVSDGGRRGVRGVVARPAGLRPGQGDRALDLAGRGPDLEPPLARSTRRPAGTAIPARSSRTRTAGCRACSARRPTKPAAPPGRPR